MTNISLELSDRTLNEIAKTGLPITLFIEDAIDSELERNIKPVDTTKEFNRMEKVVAELEERITEAEQKRNEHPELITAMSEFYAYKNALDIVKFYMK